MATYQDDVKMEESPRPPLPATSFKTGDKSSDERTSVTKLTAKQAQAAFTVDCHVGRGRFAQVWGATENKTARRVALKKVWSSKFRNEEARIMRFLAEETELCKNVISWVAYFRNWGEGVVLATPLYDIDFWHLLESMRKQTQAFDTDSVRYITRALCAAVRHLHKHKILHRDLKTANMLINGRGELVICDFGQSRRVDFSYESGAAPLKSVKKGAGNLTSQVGTLTNKAPELLYGTTQYTTGPDLWAIGCVILELCIGDACWSGDTDIHHLSLICADRGALTKERWPEVETYCKHWSFLAFKDVPRKPLTELAPGGSANALAIADALLRYDPDRRISAEAALRTGWLAADITCPESLLSLVRQHSRMPRAADPKEALSEFWDKY